MGENSLEWWVVLAIAACVAVLYETIRLLFSKDRKYNRLFKKRK